MSGELGGWESETPSHVMDSDWLLLETLDLRESRPFHTGRFLTMHKRRRRRLTTRTLVQERALLDDIYHGQAKVLLERSANWNFNAFALDNMTGGRSLPVLCAHLFHWYGLIDHFSLDAVLVWKLFSLIEEGYHGTNPYHNAIHATDVTQAMHCFLQEDKIREHLTPLEAMAALLAAVTHDLDHPGVNQPFLVATSNHLAALYKNTSVLENHHWRSAMGCVVESGVGLVLGQTLVAQLEEQLRSLILATDITRQQEFLTRFKRYLDCGGLDMQDASHRHFILQIALKCADICNPCRPWEVSRRWSHKVCEEFFRQGDYERKLNLPVTSLCDRQSTSVPKIQSGFFKFVVSPLFEEWHRFLGTPLSTGMLGNLNHNHTRWEGLLQQELAEETRTEMSDTEPAEVLDSSEEENSIGGGLGVTQLPLGSSSSDPSTHTSRRASGSSLFTRNEEGVTPSVLRRYSVPLSLPRPPAARTIIRRESLPLAPPRRFPSATIWHRDDGIALSTLSIISGVSVTATLQPATPRDAEALLPEPSIASISLREDTSRLASLLHRPPLPRLSRQQTFPPPQHSAAAFRARYLSAALELSSCCEEVGSGSMSASASASATSEADELLEGGSHTVTSGASTPSSHGDAPPTCQNGCGTPPVVTPSTPLPPPLPPSFQENLPSTAARKRLQQRLSHHQQQEEEEEREKENLAPSCASSQMSGSRGSRGISAWRQRAWRSLTEEVEAEVRSNARRLSQGPSSRLQNRRGSAPVGLLKVEETASSAWWISSRGEMDFGGEHPRWARRASAPMENSSISTTVNNNNGRLVLRASRDNSRGPLLGRRGSLPEAASLDPHHAMMWRLTARRGSVPSDPDAYSTNSKAMLGKRMAATALKRRRSGGPELFSWALGQGGNSSEAAVVMESGLLWGSLEILGGGSRARGPGPPPLPLLERRRGSLPIDALTSGSGQRRVATWLESS